MAAYGDHTAAAGVYTIGTALSWTKNIALIGAVTAANIKLLKHQRSDYKDLHQTHRDLITAALDNFVDSLNSLINGDDLKNAYPDIPRAALYRKVKQGDEQRAVIDANIAAIPRANDLSQTLNHLNYQIDLARAISLDPRWLINMDMHSVLLRDLMRGRLPMRSPGVGLTDADELEEFALRAKIPSNLFGRNIGLSRGRMEAAGRIALGEEAVLADRVSPVGRQSGIPEWQLKPETRIAMAMSQAQLVQNSLQNYFNQQAQKPPVRMAKLQLRLERAMNRLQLEYAKAGLTNSFVPNYAAALQPQINALASGISKGIDQVFAPSTPQSSYNSPSYGGDYQQQSASGAYTTYPRAGLG